MFHGSVNNWKYASAHIFIRCCACQPKGTMCWRKRALFIRKYIFYLILELIFGSHSTEFSFFFYFRLFYSFQIKLTSSCGLVMVHNDLHTAHIKVASIQTIGFILIWWCIEAIQHFTLFFFSPFFISFVCLLLQRQFNSSLR